MTDYFHALRREKACTYQVAEDTACAVPFVGPPNMRYCPEHRKAHRERQMRVWRKRAEVNAKLGDDKRRGRR